MLIVHSPRCLDYAAAGHPESPERVRRAVAALEHGAHTWVRPEPCTDEDILRVHTRAHLNSVKRGDFSDADTPHYPNIDELARLAAGGAILAAEKALAGQPAFSLMRPPGHHAERDRVMGFCYFNNIAIAVAKVLESPDHRVAILDFDCHHGNGTEDIFRGDKRTLFVSLHQSPCYPGTGLDSEGNIVNYALPPRTNEEEFIAAFDNALEQIQAYQPTLLAISAGFDSYKLDPITQMELEIESFRTIGERLGKFCGATPVKNTPLPCFAVLEGGYSRDFAQCVEAFVEGWSETPITTDARH